MALPNQQIVDNGGGTVNGDKKKPALLGKRKRNTKKEAEKKDVKKPRATRTRPQQQTEYFEDKRNLEDLWKAAFPVGTEWHNLDAVYNEFNWDFKTLEEEFEERGILYGKKVFGFGITESDIKGIVHVPSVVAVESPFPPSDKLAITSVQGAAEKIVPMKQMKMDWVPYIPFEKRDIQVDRMSFQIFILGCTQRRSALRHLKEDRIKKFEYSLPYFYNPFVEDALDQSTEVDIVFPSEPAPVVCVFDWKYTKLQELVDDQIEEEKLAAEKEDEFKEFVKEQVRAAKKANREAREAREKAIEEMSEETKEAFQSIKFYKFYPRPSPHVPTFLTTSFINRYYGKAHQVL
ncbi:PREDICTED: uncharacterized protein LOC104761519 isoform X2 [Camelina sativa]|uniref:Uncharacterized protein LOC104761519 isoform X2 n=1 Tax=Camelina sativa TaxID=90675 RepID=A0ABM1RAQ1_CAMSA|nr:PREDICTED: uncharacterized protein LOC104761519 isoform X2 [Camelina sativa]